MSPVTKRINNCYAGIAALPWDALQELVDSPDMQHVIHDLTRCVILMELLYRLDSSHPEMPGLVWTLVFGDVVAVPEGLMSPSEAHPELRRWTRH
jgi:hypothetical protein